MSKAFEVRQAKAEAKAEAKEEAARQEALEQVEDDPLATFHAWCTERKQLAAEEEARIYRKLCAAVLEAQAELERLNPKPSEGSAPQSLINNPHKLKAHDAS